MDHQIRDSLRSLLFRYATPVNRGDWFSLVNKNIDSYTDDDWDIVENHRRLRHLLRGEGRGQTVPYPVNYLRAGPIFIGEQVPRGYEGAFHDAGHHYLFQNANGTMPVGWMKPAGKKSMLESSSSEVSEVNSPVEPVQTAPQPPRVPKLRPVSKLRPLSGIQRIRMKNLIKNRQKIYEIENDFAKAVSENFDFSFDSDPESKDSENFFGDDFFGDDFKDRDFFRDDDFGDGVIFF